MNARLTISEDKLYRLLFSSLILAAPLIVFGFYLGGMSIRLSRVLVLLMLPALLVRFAKKPTLFMRDGFLIVCFAPYLIYTTLTTVWSADVATGTTYSRLGGLYEIFAIYLIMIGADLNPSRYARFIRVYVASAVVPLGFAVWQLANNLFQFSASELPFQDYLIEGKYEELEGRYFVASEGISRMSATFAEPVIFSTYLASVILFSFLIKPQSSIVRALMTLFRAVACLVLMLSISKLALLSITIGLFVITLSHRNYLKFLAFVVGLFLIMLLVLWQLDLVFLLERLTTETGHLELLYQTLGIMEHANLIFGEGIGSIPYGSFHRFVLSRVYESGLMGLYFVVFVTVLPFFLRDHSTDRSLREVTNISRAVLIALLFGLHSYDFFIHLWPWIVIGAVASFNNSMSQYRSADVRMPAVVEALPRPANP